ncbi:hypothetical protein PHJA_000221600 [Phtheirospermum japonicum]|uniref:Uncharacterized protein n=1 Tax=Phtheirospermum japonicum TaxID=374723 RepID=A0A830B8G9_9LAMI|nr:hypothetical protein PHJA_000221600 [Phtheirospermum japonicum]
MGALGLSPCRSPPLGHVRTCPSCLNHQGGGVREGANRAILLDLLSHPSGKGPCFAPRLGSYARVSACRQRKLPRIVPAHRCQSVRAASAMSPSSRRHTSFSTFACAQYPDSPVAKARSRLITLSASNTEYVYVDPGLICRNKRRLYNEDETSNLTWNSAFFPRCRLFLLRSLYRSLLRPNLLPPPLIANFYAASHLVVKPNFHRSKLLKTIFSLENHNKRLGSNPRIYSVLFLLITVSKSTLPDLKVHIHHVTTRTCSHLCGLIRWSTVRILVFRAAKRAARPEDFQPDREARLRRLMLVQTTKTFRNVGMSAKCSGAAGDVVQVLQK